MKLNTYLRVQQRNHLVKNVKPCRQYVLITAKKTVTNKTQPIIPNPYRDEFIEYKEKLISEIS